MFTSYVITYIIGHAIGAVTDRNREVILAIVKDRITRARDAVVSRLPWK